MEPEVTSEYPQRGKKIGGGVTIISLYDIIKDKFKDAKTHRGNNSCLWDDINMLDHHLKSDDTGSKHVKVCK